MKLLDFVDYEVKVNPEALLVKPIRVLYNKDKSAGHEKFFQQMSYLYFMVDPRSTYSYVTDDSARAALVIKQEGLPKTFKPSKELKEAMEIYKQHTITTSQRLLQSAKISVDKVRSFLENVDLTEEDDNGKPKYQISNITTALKNVTALVPAIQDLEKKVEQEIEEKGRARGTQKVMFEDGFDFGEK